MPWFKTHVKQQGGKVIQASTLADMARTCDQFSRLQAEQPLSVLWTAVGPLLRYAGMIFGAYIGITSGTISARSGSTPGSGPVAFQTWNGSALVSLGASQTCYSISSTTGGIPSGAWCVVLKIGGVYWLISVDCGN